MKSSGHNMVCFLIFFSSLHVCAQTGIWNTPNAYLAQQAPVDTPKVFAGGQILRDSGIVLSRVAFTADGREFYYTFARHWFSSEGTGVKRIVFDGTTWRKPEIICDNLSNPTLSLDGRILYLHGSGNTVYKMERVGEGWGSSVKFLDLPYALYNFMPTRSGRFYAGSNGDRGKKSDYSAYDFSVLTIKPGDTVITSLGAPLNTPGFDGDLYVAPDESFMIISTHETPTYECELYISFRRKNGSWKEPLSLGPLINDGKAHRFGQYVSPDGKYLFYTKGTNENDCNFYWVRWDNLFKKLKAQSDRTD